MKTKLDIAKAKKAKRQEQTDDIKALVSEIKRFNDEFQPQEPIDLTELQKQLAELPVLIQQPLSSSLEGFLSAFKTHLVTTISKNKQDPDLSRLIKDIKIENKIDLKPLTKEIRNLREKAAKQSQNPEDFVPYRRVIKSGNKLVFDDNITAGGGGGGGSGTSFKDTTGKLVYVELTADGSIPVTVKNSLTPNVDFDYIDIQQTSATVETYVYKQGGVSGTTVQTITVTYTDSTKNDLDKVEYS
jgi:hypothetical protein